MNTAFLQSTHPAQARRRSFNGFIQRTLFVALAAVTGAQTTLAATPASNIVEIGGLQLTQDWDKVFPRSDKVEHQKVTFKNRYGITLAADLYLPKSRGPGRLPAIVVSGPFGAVKEQSSGLYAQTLAERGFVTLAFDPSFTGESGGAPRNVASPDINTEDVSAAVDFIGLQSHVDRERIGAVGVCGWGGITLNAVAVDKRIKAVVASTMYDISRVVSKGYNDSVTPGQRAQALAQLGRQRWADAEKGAPAYQPPYNELRGGEAQFLVEYHDYYRTPRGYHPRAVNSGNAWTITNNLSFMNFPQLTYIKEISPRPILFVHGEKAHSRYFTETAYAAAEQPKELLIIPGANHVDLYDQLDKIPFDRIATFFNENLK
ncbi:Dienelactone hydrolase and related enzymes [plant metagenome]|uniref:Dienelactone hydrolase and related enzymes n=1 Tax=plant metagenome TaxID=1297885 RepID=A0A484UQY7_9ZZZZ